MNNREIENIIHDAEDALNSFDKQAADTNSFPFSMELYELIYNMLTALKQLTEKTDNNQETDHVRYNRLAVEELSDRLSDAISENIQLAVEIRARGEKAVQENEAAARKFMSDVVGNLFNTTKGTQQ